MTMRTVDVDGVLTSDVRHALNANFASLLAGSILHQATVTFTNAEIKTLPGLTPRAVTPAPGVGKVPVLLHASALLHTVAAYTSVSGDGHLMLHTPLPAGERASSIVLLSGVTGFNTIGDGLLTFQPGAMANVDPESDYVGTIRAPIMAIATLNNGSLMLGGYNGGALTGGHADNTLEIVTLYMILDLATGQYE